MIEWVVRLAATYAMLGALFGGVFVTVGVGRLDPAARGAGWGFRLLILPGVAALWPMMLFRWVRGQRVPPTEKNPHRDAAGRGDE
ncbi:MAG: hypothetical protein ACKVX9_05560 [Blastocatellia bacterium]